MKLKLKINGEKWKERVCEKEMEGGKEEWVEGKGGGKVLVKQSSFLLCVKIVIESVKGIQKCFNACNSNTCNTDIFNCNTAIDILTY